MTIAVDLIVIVIILLSTYLGYKKGLIGVAFKIISFLIALAVTLILFKPVSNYIIDNTQFDETIQNIIVEKLSNQEIEDGKVKKEDTKLPNVMVDYINEQIENTVDQAKNSAITIMAKNLSETLVSIIVMLSLFALTKLVLLFAKAILQAVSEIPIIKQFNQTGGVIYGILRGALLIYIILAIISLILPMIEKTIILEAINNSFITKILYNNNIILNFFFK